ncbi:MAG: NADPH-dependent F420 reductase [Rhodospirillaceae bacterium]|jgi:8-hydroxy-5-deazaflavin:NADPH oxidoreductase|nr:NADPH-dependent F420 reductase [Rhodospirillaceae bacterium]MBT5456932.1 NADPH-dependent F420 reductase [Rhodospirillaceae bacterium]
MTDSLPTIAVLGGTGHEGWGLALRWALAGYKVIIGSRSAEKAAEAAAEIGAIASEQLTPSELDFDRAELERRAARPVAEQVMVQGMANSDAVAACDIAVMTVPYAAQQPTVEALKGALAGKILVDVTVPLVPPKVLRVQLPEGGSAVANLQEFVGESVRVVSAFQNIAAAHLRDPDHEIACDVLVCGDNKAARSEVIKLADAAGMKGWHGGPIANSAAAEALTSLLLFINRNYGIEGSGFQITGTPSKDPG